MKHVRTRGSSSLRRRGLLWKDGALFLAGVGLVAGLITAGAYWVVRDLPEPERIRERSIAESTKIYDRTGTVLLYEVHGEEKRTIVALEEVPETVRNATIAAEDINFYKHVGIDLGGITRAFFKNVSRGEIAQGGSTITQQLIKNSLLTSERTFARKIKEAILAILIERQYSKDEILALYLNQIPYGSNAYGIASAAETYFGKKVRELSLEEAALLASLPKAPTYYSPYGSHKAELLERKNWILERMREAGFISEEAAENAKKAPLVFAPPQKVKSLKAPHFVAYIREYLAKKYGEEFIERGGLRVTTTLDATLQDAAEKAVVEGAKRNLELVEAGNAALVAIDPRNGDILAMVGSRDFWGKPYPAGCTPGVNCKFDPYVNATIRLRQPGSAFKPFVYATAFKKGYAPETTLFDVPTEFNPFCNPDGTPGPLINDEKECYHPQNYDQKFRGPVTLRQSLAQSLNVPSVKLLYLAGINDSIETASSAGITTLTDPARYGLSLVLGGAEVSLLELTSAYGVFAAEGILHPYRSILKIESSSGAVLEEAIPSPKVAIDTEVARRITNVLSDNDARIPVFSPRSSLYFPDREVAAKTGTSQDFRDAWTIGYAPSLVAGVWVGNNDNTPMRQSALSIMVAGPIFHQFMNAALANTPPEEFVKPEEKLPENPYLRGVYRAGGIIKIDALSKKRATEFTPPELIQEISFGKIEPILAFIRKENPLGDPPLNPRDDPQYPHWKWAIDAWLSKNPIPETPIPQEFDTLHTPQTQPKISLSLPLEVPSPLNTITVEISLTYPLEELTLFINDELIQAKTFPILGNTVMFNLEHPLLEGVYVIKITARDAVKNRVSFEKEITVRRSDLN